MPLYMDVHYVPDASEEDLAKAHLADTAIQEHFGVTCQTYWLNKRTGTANCLLEASGAEQVNALHKASHGLEAHKIIEVSEDVVEAFLGKIDQTPVAIDPGTTQTGSSLRIILFTDIVGSTQMAQDFGDEVAMKVLQTHDTIVRGALQMHGGSEVKHTGDGIMASFASVSGSVKSAIDMQNGIADYNQTSPEIKLHVRIGLSAGEPVEKDQDLFGTAVNLAARICNHADAEEILLAHTVRELCAGKGFNFRELDEVSFKGFDEPTKIGSVVWQNQ